MTEKQNYLTPACSVVMLVPENGIMLTGSGMTSNGFDDATETDYEW